MSISIRFPDGNINTFEVQNGQVISLRNIFVSHGQNLPPFEVSILIDENSNTIVGKNDNLKTDIPYKLVDCREMIKCFNSLRDLMNQRDKQIQEQQKVIMDFQQKIDSQQKSINDQEKQYTDDLQKKDQELQSLLKNEKEMNQKLENQKIQMESQQKQHIDEIQKQKTSSQELNNRQEIELKQIEKQNKKLKTKYQKYKDMIGATTQKTIENQSTIAGLKKDVEYKSEKIIEKEREIKKMEEQYQKQLNDQKINYDNQIQREYEKYKDVDNRLQAALKQYQDYLKEQQDQLNKSNRDSIVKTKEEQNSNLQHLQLKNDLEQQINNRDDQIKSLKFENNIKDDNIKKLTYDLEQISKEFQKQKKQLNEFEEKIQSLEKEIESLNICIKNLQTQICNEDLELLQRDEKIQFTQLDLYNNYKYRLMRLVELIPRDYKEEINFAVEDMFQNKYYKKKEKLIDQTYKVYKLDHQKAKDIIFDLSNLDIQQTISPSHRSIIYGQLSQQKIVSEEKCHNESRLIDSLQLYYSTKIDTLNEYFRKTKSEACDKIYIIKETYTNQTNNLSEKDYTINLLSRPIVAQIILDAFVTELKNKNINIPFNFQFVQPVLFSIDINFKQYFFELLSKQKDKYNTKAFQTLKSFMDLLKDDKSNDFYGYLRELQLKRVEVKSQDGKIIYESDKQAQTQFLQTFIELCFEDKERDPFKNIVQQFNQCSNEEKLKTFKDLMELLIETYNSFPSEKFFYGYELNLKDINDQTVFKKYNGGNIKFDQSEEGKFLSALSYYSIQRTHYQFCVSHIQGIGNLLYDPVVSSYDGFLNCLDQGLNEIRNIESAFVSSDPQKIGSKYIEALDINIQ